MLTNNVLKLLIRNTCKRDGNPLPFLKISNILVHVVVINPRTGAGY